MDPEPAPAAAAEVAPAAPQKDLEHAIEIIDGEHTKYPAALASHEKVLEDKELFLALLQDLCTKLQDAEPKQWRPTKFRVPTGALPSCCCCQAARVLCCCCLAASCVSRSSPHKTGTAPSPQPVRLPAA